MCGQGGGCRPGCARADDRVEVFQQRLIDPADVTGEIPGQGTSGQVVDHVCVQAQVVQRLARVFQVVVLAQKHPVGAVGKIEQGQAVDLLLNERDAGQGGRPLMLGVLTAHGQVCGQ
ncbi:hypothetical protein D3C87_1309920 [compost metagenome]